MPSRVRAREPLLVCTCIAHGWLVPTYRVPTPLARLLRASYRLCPCVMPATCTIGYAPSYEVCCRRPCVPAFATLAAQPSATALPHPNHEFRFISRWPAAISVPVTTVPVPVPLTSAVRVEMWSVDGQDLNPRSLYLIWRSCLNEFFAMGTRKGATIFQPELASSTSGFAASHSEWADTAQLEWPQPDRCHPSPQTQRGKHEQCSTFRRITITN